MKSLKQDATKILHKRQIVAPYIDENLFIRVIIRPFDIGNKTQRTITTSYNALSLGRAGTLFKVMKTSFPKLGLTRKDCLETSWIKSVLYITGFPSDTPPKVLLKGKSTFKNFFKAKSDFVAKVADRRCPLMIWNPYGGNMSQFSKSDTLFPHKNETLYKIHYQSMWQEGDKNTAKHIDWIRKLYNYMGPYISILPREAYVNYWDLDLGVNSKNKTSYIEASSWGYRCFRNNFDGLEKIKTKVDYKNIFKHE